MTDLDPVLRSRLIEVGVDAVLVAQVEAVLDGSEDAGPYRIATAVVDALGIATGDDPDDRECGYPWGCNVPEGVTLFTISAAEDSE